MKSISDAAIAAMTDGNAISSAAIVINCSPPVAVWGGYGQLVLDGITFDGIGDRGLVQLMGASLGDSEQNVGLQLSGVEPDIVALFDATQVRGAPVKIWLLIFDGSGQIPLDAQVYTAGRLDTLQVVETVGGTSTICASVETQARGLGRSGQRMRTDADQRLIDAADSGFRVVSFAGNKTLYWGGYKPTSVATLGWSPLPTAN